MIKPAWKQISFHTGFRELYSLPPLPPPASDARLPKPKDDTFCQSEVCSYVSDHEELIISWRQYCFIEIRFKHHEAQIASPLTSLISCYDNYRLHQSYPVLLF